MFFAIPLNNKPDWRNPPLATILLILLNFIIYFGPQRLESKALDKAADYYVASQVLPEMEIPRYANFLRQSGDPKQAKLADAVEDAWKKKQAHGPLQAMENDRPFQKLLAAGQIIKPDEESYQAWADQRAKFQSLKGTAFTERWASNPSDWNPLSLITSVFLHGSASHLIGNMLFLFLFGYTVEQTLGTKRYLALYLLAGACGDLGDLLSRWNSPIIGLGASGAISGLMASYAVLYGRQRIRFFYQFLFYFDYVKAPAIILLPVWIGHEFLQQAINSEGGIAYMAHAGGLLSGAALTYCFRQLNPEKTTVATPVVAVEDPAIALLAKANVALKALKIDEACEIYRKLIKLQPRNHEFISTYFNLAKRTPGDEHFHRAFRYVVALADETPDVSQWVYERYQTYVGTAEPPRLTPDLIGKLAFRFARDGRSKETDRLYRMLATREAAHQALPGILLALVSAMLKQGHRPQAQEYRQLLETQHNSSAEAMMAADLLR